MSESNFPGSLQDTNELPEIQPQPALQEVEVGQTNEPEMPVTPTEKSEIGLPSGGGLDPERWEKTLIYRKKYLPQMKAKAPIGERYFNAQELRDTLNGPGTTRQVIDKVRSQIVEQSDNNTFISSSIFAAAAAHHLGYKAEDVEAVETEVKSPEEALNDPFFSDFDPVKAYTPDFVATKGLQEHVAQEDRKFLDSRIRMKNRSLGAKLRSAGKSLWGGLKNAASSVLPGAAARKINSDLREAVSLGEITEAEFTDLKQKTVTDKVMGWFSGRGKRKATSRVQKSSRKKNLSGGGNNPGNPGGGSDGGSNGDPNKLLVPIPKKSRWKRDLGFLAAGVIATLGGTKAYDHYADGQTNQPTAAASPSTGASVSGVSTAAPTGSYGSPFVDYPSMSGKSPYAIPPTPKVAVTPVPTAIPSTLPTVTVEIVEPPPAAPPAIAKPAKTSTPKQPAPPKVVPKRPAAAPKSKVVVKQIPKPPEKTELEIVLEEALAQVDKNRAQEAKKLSALLAEISVVSREVERASAIAKKIPVATTVISNAPDPKLCTKPEGGSVDDIQCKSVSTIKIQKEALDLLSSATITLEKLLDPNNGLSIQQEAEEFVNAQKKIDKAAQLADSAEKLSIAQYAAYAHFNIGSARQILNKLKGMDIPTSSSLIFKDSGQSFDNLDEFQRQLSELDAQTKKSISLDTKGAEKLYFSTKGVNNQLGELLCKMSPEKNKVKSVPFHKKTASVVIPTKHVVRSTVTGDQLRADKNPWIMPKTY